MFEARISKPVTSAFAVGTVARIGGSLKHDGLRDLALATAPLPHRRGVSR